MGNAVIAKNVQLPHQKIKAAINAALLLSCNAQFYAHAHQTFNQKAY